MEAFVEWTKEMIDRYPDVVFENCAGGGQRFDQRFMSMFQVVSTSDQTDYALYPYIVGNIFTAILPEQAAIWAYPLHTALYDDACRAGNDSCVHPEHVALNMVTGILGRFHLSSHLEHLGSQNSDLIREAVAVYNQMTPFKLQSVPYLPKGYAQMDDPFVAVGLKGEKKVYLAVWNLLGEKSVSLELPELEVADVQVAYPKSLPTAYSYDGGVLNLEFTRDEQARLFEITLK
jgi:alpha-galactosidase